MKIDTEKLSIKAKRLRKNSNKVAGKINLVSNIAEKTISKVKNAEAIRSLNQSVDEIMELEKETTKIRLVSNEYGITERDLPKKASPKILGNISDRDMKNFLVKFPRTAMTAFDASKELIVIAVWLATVLKIGLPSVKFKPPAVVNKIMGTFVMQSMKRLGDRELALMSLTFASWVLRKSFFESSQDQLQNFLDSDGYNELEVLPNSRDGVSDAIVNAQKEFYLDKTQHFILDNGIVLKSLSSKDTIIDTLSISLKYHMQNTVDNLDFVLSVQKYVNNHNKYLTDFDIERLIEHYKKYNN